MPARSLLDRLWNSLFSTPLNAVLTVLAGYVLYTALAPAVRWLVIDADFAGSTRSDCTGGGACWVFIKARMAQFVYGFYPADQTWRVQFVALLAVSLGGLAALLKGRPRIWALVALVGVLPPLATVLLLGGIGGLPYVRTSEWGGLMLTLLVAAAGMALAMPVGVLLALGRRSRLPVVRLLSVAYIELWRAVPLITVLFMAAVMLPLFLPRDVELDKLLRAIIGVAMFNSAYVAEAVRGGLQGVDEGQYEASRALGLGYWTMMALVVLPQALRIALPGIVGTLIGLVKDTTLLLVIGIFDLLGTVQAAAGDSSWLGFAAEGYLFVAAVFWVLCFGVSRLGRRLENRMAPASHR